MVCVICGGPVVEHADNDGLNDRLRRICPDADCLAETIRAYWRDRGLLALVWTLYDEHGEAVPRLAGLRKGGTCLL